MGIYSTNRFNSLGADITLEAAEGYNGEIGAALAMLEGYQNDMAIFNGVIASDFQAAAAVHEGAGDDEVYVLQEASLKGAWEALINFFKKLGEKIKGIFKAFIAKMDSVFMKDSAAFYKKYEADIRKKDKWTDFSVKVRAPKDSGKLVLDFADQDNFMIKSFTSADAAQKALDFDAEEEFSLAVTNNMKDMPSNVTEGEFEKEYYDIVFEDPDDVEFTADDILGGWVGQILNKKKGLSDLQDKNNKIERQIKTIIANIEKAKSEVDKVWKDVGKSNTSITTTRVASVSGNAVGKDERGGANTQMADTKEAKDTVQRYQKMYQLANKKANILQNVFTKYASVSVKAYKEVCSSARKVFAAAVAWSPKAESAFVAAVADSAYYEAVDMIDTMYDIAG